MVLTPFERGLVAHLVADWVLQTDWMARNKISLRHPAAWTHAAIQAACLGLALGWQAALVLGLIHLLIDTRVPVAWWMRVFKKCGRAPEAVWIAIWLDQTLHIGCLALWLACAGRL
jgi:ABC-type phosphate/phosphonate transport system permease subunit